MGILSWLYNLVYGAKDKEITVLKTQIVSLESDKTVLRGQLQDANVSLDYYKFQLFEAEKQVALLEAEVCTLKDWLREAIQIPDISSLINTETMGKVDPYDVKILEGYYLSAADPLYHTFPKESWLLILDLAYKEVKEALKRWKKNISDCDNWAYTMGDVVSLAFASAGLSYQGFFMIGWSTTHAYNVFLDADGEAWVYEPQNNTVIGKLGETSSPHDTRLLWILV